MIQRLFMAVAVLLSSLTAFGAEIYTCALEGKANSVGYKKVFYLSPIESNTIEIGIARDVSDLTISVRSDGSLRGFIPDQLRPVDKPLVSGDLEHAILDSAFVEGVISCDERSFTAAQIYMGRSWNPIEARGAIPGLPLFAKACYKGVTDAVASAIMAKYPQAEVSLMNQGVLRLSREETRCLESTGSYDNFECLKEVKETKNYDLVPCAEEEDHYPPYL